MYRQTIWMRSRNVIANIVCAVSVLGLTGCGDSGPTNAFNGAPSVGGLTIVTSSLPDGTVNQAYSTSLSGSGGTAPYTWSVTPALPANLSLNATTGTISGTPAGQGTTLHTFTLRDNLSPPQTVQQTLTLTITVSAVLTITTSSLPAGTLGQDYNQTLQATGGIGSRNWSISAGNLPQGLNLNQTTGVISGTPTGAGTSTFTVRVQDAAGEADTQQLSIVINLTNPPIITTTTLPGGTVGQPYSQALQASGGILTLTWSLASGSLPAMLSLSSAGVITGTPTNTGTANFTVRVRDSLNQSDTEALSITVSAALAITTTSLPDAEVGKAYSRTLQRSGGVAPFTWSVMPALPNGLNLNASTGQITGTPAAGTAGDYDLTFTVQDSSTPKPQIAGKVLQLTVKP